MDVKLIKTESWSDDHMEYGTKFYDDGRQIDFCRLHTFYPYQPNSREYAKPKFQWKASDIIKTLKVADGRPVYVIQESPVTIGILDGKPMIWFKNKYRYDGKNHDLDLILS